MHPLYDKVALITGGSSGIGRALALRLAGYGARIGVAARNEKALEEVVREAAGRGAEALAVPADVGDALACRRAVEAVVERFGRLDILICSAGLSMRGYFEGSDLAAMERTIRVNLFGTLYATYYALPHVKRSRGSLVAISSLSGLRGIPSFAAYGASKFALVGLYDSLRLELARDGVHVGVVAPGFVDTPLHAKMLAADGQPYATLPPVPFRTWPVEKCVDKIVRLLVKRRARALLPGFVGPLLVMDRALGNWIGDWILKWNFPPPP